MDGIEGKVIAVTGASGGIGLSTARLLAERGAKVVLGARREEQLKAVVEEMTSAGRQAIYVVTDVRRRQDLDAFVARAVEQYGKLDVLVSNAGIGPLSPIEDLRVADWDDMIDINFKSLLYGVAAAMPVFRRQKSGHFVNVLSTAGLKIVPLQAVYAATKNAARTFAEGLRQEAGPDLRVTSVSPGFVYTDFAHSMTDAKIKEATLQARDKMAIPPDAIARAIAFAIEQPADVDVGEIVIRPTAQA